MCPEEEYFCHRISYKGIEGRYLLAISLPYLYKQVTE